MRVALGWAGILFIGLWLSAADASQPPVSVRPPPLLNPAVYAQLREGANWSLPPDDPDGMTMTKFAQKKRPSGNNNRGRKPITNTARHAPTTKNISRISSEKWPASPTRISLFFRSKKIC